MAFLISVAGPVGQFLSCLGAFSRNSSSRPVGQALSSLHSTYNCCHRALQFLWKMTGSLSITSGSGLGDHQLSLQVAQHLLSPAMTA